MGSTEIYLGKECPLIELQYHFHQSSPQYYSKVRVGTGFTARDPFSSSVHSFLAGTQKPFLLKQILDEF